jgi:hypothetical protein
MTREEELDIGLLQSSGLYRRSQSMGDKRAPNSPEYETDTTTKTDQAEELVDLAEMLSKWDDPAVKARTKAESLFLQNLVFRGLTELKPKFDSPLIAHFHAADFIQVIDRCTVLGIYIIGIEIFTPKGWPVDIEISEEDSNSWCLSLVRRYRKRKHLHYCATYRVPDQFLGWPPKALKSRDQSLAAPDV